MRRCLKLLPKLGGDQHGEAQVLASKDAFPADRKLTAISPSPLTPLLLCGNLGITQSLSLQPKLDDTSNYYVFCNVSHVKYMYTDLSNIRQDAIRDMHFNALLCLYTEQTLGFQIITFI